MKHMVYKLWRNIRMVFIILRAGARFGWEQETAYVFNNWATLISTIFYNVTFYFFTKVLYLNINSIAGYGFDESLVILLIAQFTFYFSYSFYISNILAIAKYVNTGYLDMLLVKPVPTLPYLAFHKISLYSFLRNGLISIALIAALIDYSNLNISLLSVLAFIVVHFLGLISLLFFNLLFVIPVFWLERSEALLEITHKLEWYSRREVPYEGFSSQIQFTFTYLLPLLTSTLLAVSTLLSKTPALEAISIALVSTFCFSSFVYILWKMSLKRYSSASS